MYENLNNLNLLRYYTWKSVKDTDSEKAKSTAKALEKEAKDKANISPLES